MTVPILIAYSFRWAAGEVLKRQHRIDPNHRSLRWIGKAEQLRGWNAGTLVCDLTHYGPAVIDEDAKELRRYLGLAPTQFRFTFIDAEKVARLLAGEAVR